MLHLRSKSIYKISSSVLLAILLNFTMNITKSYAQNWNSIPGTNGTIYAMLYDNLNGWLYIGGDFTIVGGVPANRIARWDGTIWSALGTGLNNTVRALSFYPYSTNIVAGGDFTSAGSITANRIALWNGSSWIPAFASGMNDIVCALTLYTPPPGSQTYLIAGGNFTTAGGINANRLAAWIGSWTYIGNGVNDSVFSLTASEPPANTYLYIGGSFTMSGTSIVKRTARLLGITGSPSQLGAGIDDGTVYALAIYGPGTTLYAGGSFIMIGGITFNRIARWTGNWSLVGTGINNTVYSLYTTNTVTSPGILCVGGLFTDAGGVPADRVATWNNSNWGTLGSGMSGGNPSIVRAFRDFRMVLAAGGLFTSAGGISVSNIAIWGSVPNAPNTISPACGALGQSLTPTLDWSDVPNTWRYGLQLSKNPNFNPLILDLTGIVASQYTISSGILQNDSIYFWRVNATNGLGTGSWSQTCWFQTLFTGIKYINKDIPVEFRIYQNYPNPFNPVTKIKFDIPAASLNPEHSGQPLIQIKVFDMLGREVATLVNKQLNPGTYEVDWDASKITSGVYYYKLISGDFSETRKMVIIK